ncbi:MAG: NYN domain-containing protein [Lachnospiraceae bacterium]
MTENNVNFAVLIDADNVSHKHIKTILDEIANFGNATYRRIYGNWTSPNTAGWRDVLLEYSIIPVQQYSYTTGKNATDSAMIIDAMDILYSNNVAGFCIVSSDSDFTRLASRLRESGKTVIGMGESKTPPPFVKACSQFKYLDVLTKATTQTVQSSSSSKPSLERLELEIISIISNLSDEDGWCAAAEIGNRLTRRLPDFDPKNYGYNKLGQLMKDLNKIELKNVTHPNDRTVPLLYARIKQEQF